MSWLNYLQSETKTEDLAYLEEKTTAITERVRKGKDSVTAETNASKKTRYQNIVNELSMSRNFYTALLRFRDWELPRLLGGVIPTDKEAGDKRCELIFQEICTMSHNLSCHDMDAEEDMLRTQGVNLATKKPVGQKLLEQMAVFDLDYDMFDAPMFYRDLVLTLNLISDFHDEVMKQVKVLKKKKAAAEKAAN